MAKRIEKRISKKIAIIGLGEIGSATLGEMLRISKSKKLGYEFHGVDINDETLEKLKKKFPEANFGKKIPEADYYIISVYTTEQVESVISNIPKGNNPLIVIEATIFPKTAEKLKSISRKNKINIALFPHRFNPNDPEHFVFNLSRILGGINQKSLKKSMELYIKFMPKKLITPVSFEIAALSKVAENAYRFIEIAVAEDWKKECDKLGINFYELRKTMNTKWNIDVKEARDGIGGKCLPKDTALLNKFFKTNKILRSAIAVDKEYKKQFEKR